MHTSIHSGRTGNHPASPHAMALRLMSCSPRRSGFLVTVAGRITSANLTPASRRQDHTTSPSASWALSSEAPPASIASNPASVTIAIRPLSGVDGGGYKLICDFGKPEYFFRWDWAGQITLIRFRKLDFRRKSARHEGDVWPGSSQRVGARAETIECTVTVIPRDN